MPLLVRTGFCESQLHNATLEAHVYEIDLGLRVGHAWDLSLLTLELGAGLATSLFVQSFSSQGSAPTRRTLAGSASLYAALLYELKRGIYLGLDLEAQLYVISLLEGHKDELRAAFAGRSALLLGKHF